MKFYNKYILPQLINRVCSQYDISMMRSRLVPMAEGKTLEIGMGSGLNLPFYDPSQIDMVLGLEPVAHLRSMAAKKAIDLPFEVKLIGGSIGTSNGASDGTSGGVSGEEIPLEDNSVDTVLITYTLCTIPDVFKALKEMNRVLKPKGKLIFCEHGKSPDDHIFKWQNRLNPVWTKISGGCNLNRHISKMIQESGFKIVNLDSGYISPLKLVGFNYKGVAVPS